MVNTLGFKIGDRVKGRETGYDNPATIVGLIPAVMTPTINQNMGRWNSLYPDWKEGMLAYCRFDEPVRSLTFEEFKTQLPHDRVYQLIDGNQELLQALYEYQFKPVLHASYPIQDLEILDAGE
jgi:hypothetical protein